MNYRHVLIATYGRSGSTLLQGILNQAPGVVVRGENGGILNHIHGISRAAAFASKFAPIAESPTNPWFGVNLVDFDRYLDGLVRQFVEEILCPPEGAQLIGFKEIRYQMPYEDLSSLLRFACDRLGDCAIVVNTRDLDEVIASNVAAGHKTTPEKLRDADANLRRFVQENPANTYHIHYNDYVSDPSRLTGLLDFLGVNLSEEAVARVMGQKHSSVTRPKETDADLSP